jgi:uncharacterized protein RhaS with RHS repeats
MQQRYYDPVISRFYSNDPVDFMGHMKDGNLTSGFNRYAYANNNPYKYTDPDGEFIQAIAIGVAVGAIGGAAVEAYGQYQAGKGLDYGKIGGAAIKGAVVGASSVGLGKIAGALATGPGAGVLAKGIATNTGGVLGAAVGNTVNAVVEATGNAMDGKGFAVDDIGATNAGTVGDMVGAALGPVAGVAAAKVTGSPIASAVAREATSVGASKEVKSAMDPKK